MASPRRVKMRLTTPTSSFEAIPKELYNNIMFNLSYEEILNFCQVNITLANLCQGTQLWREMIASRYPEYMEHPDFMINPQSLFAELSTLYRVFLYPPNQPVRIEMVTREGLVGVILGLEVNPNFNSQVHILIISPTWTRMSWDQAQEIANPHRVTPKLIARLRFTYRYREEITEVEYTFDHNQVSRLLIYQGSPNLIEGLDMVIAAFGGNILAIQ